MLTSEEAPLKFWQGTAIVVVLFVLFLAIFLGSFALLNLWSLWLTFPVS